MTGQVNISFLMAFLIAVSLAVFAWLPQKTFPDENAETYVKTTLGVCLDSENRSLCLKKTALTLLDRFSIETIIAVFSSYEKEREFFTQCHELSHYLGRELYARSKDVRKTFSQGSRACLGGVYHGAIEGYLIAKRKFSPDEKYTRQTVKSVCGHSEDYEKPQEFIECNHGLGHAVMFLTDYDLLKALGLCDVLQTIGEQELCYTGAFMANADSAFSKDHPTKFIKDDDPLYPCAILPDRYAPMCYTYAVLERFKEDADKSILICMNVPSAYQYRCFETFGRDRTMISANETELKAQCGKIANAKARDHCLGGVAYNLVIRFGYESDLPRVFCAIVEEENKNTCYKQSASALGPILPDKTKRMEWCKKIKEYHDRDICQKAFNIK